MRLSGVGVKMRDMGAVTMTDDETEKAVREIQGRQATTRFIAGGAAAAFVANVALQLLFLGVYAPDGGEIGIWIVVGAVVVYLWYRDFVRRS
jgi:multisubunit Na+/H+ antiporter MnhB subunit